MKCFAYGLVIALVGCAGETNEDDYPVEPNGQDPATTPVNGNTGGTLMSGRICVSESITQLSGCRTRDLEGFQVALGTSTAMTDASGNFRVEVPSGTPSGFTVTGPGAVTTTTPYDPSLTSLRVIDADVYARAMTSNGVFATPGTGAILGSVARGGTPVSDISVSTMPSGSFQPFYDVDGTGPLGTNRPEHGACSGCQASRPARRGFRSPAGQAARPRWPAFRS